MWQEEKIALLRSGWVIAAIGLFLTFMTAFPQERTGDMADRVLTLVTGIGLALYVPLLCLPIVYREKFSRSDLVALAGGGAAIVLVGDMSVALSWQAIMLGIFILIFMATILFRGPRFNR
ncbi:MAG: hypothetical protein AB7E05_03370 [Sphingobium sp.]